MLRQNSLNLTGPAGIVSNFLSAMARGGLQFMLVIWLQGIWLPLHGYNFAETPLGAVTFLPGRRSCPGFTCVSD